MGRETEITARKKEREENGDFPPLTARGYRLIMLLISAIVSLCCIDFVFA